MNLSTKGVLIILALLCLPLTVVADGGIFSYDFKDVSLSKPLSKAVVSYGRGKEVLILTSSFQATRTAACLQVLPLPSKPKITELDMDFFRTVEKYLYDRSKKSGRAGFYLEPEYLRFDKKEIKQVKVVEAKSAKEFMNWLEGFYIEQGIDEENRHIPSDLRDKIALYVRKGMTYFAVSTVGVANLRTIHNPVMFEFETPELYYPVVMSGVSSKEMNLDLIMVTREGEDVGAEFFPEGFTKIQELAIGQKEIVSLHEKLAGMFQAWDTISLTTWHYEGSSAKKFDVEKRPRLSVPAIRTSADGTRAFGIFEGQKTADITIFLRGIREKDSLVITFNGTAVYNKPIERERKKRSRSSKNAVHLDSAKVSIGLEGFDKEGVNSLVVQVVRKGLVVDEEKARVVKGKF